MDFENKVVLVTGGGSGIGRAAALAFADEGAQVVIGDVNLDGADETVQIIQTAGGEAHAVAVDVRQAEQVEALVQAAQDTFGGLHIAVNNAGVGGAGLKRFQDYTEDDYDSIVSVNTRGVFLCMKYEIPALLQSGGGAIVNIASVAGLIGLPGNAPYSASKHAVIGLTKSAGLELARKDIRVNAVCPSYVDTPLLDPYKATDELATQLQTVSPMQRMGTPDEVARTILWLASERASFVNGASIAVDGGLTAS